MKASLHEISIQHSPMLMVDTWNISAEKRGFVKAIAGLYVTE
jgi:hypothetical protein